MFKAWLDRWDDNQASEGALVKGKEVFDLGSKLAFPNEPEAFSVSEFIALAKISDETFFDLPKGYDPKFDLSNDTLTFPSSIVTEFPNNNLVTAKVTQRGARKKALVIFHHWNAGSRQTTLAKILALMGWTVVEMAMPYHFERFRKGASHADYMLGANLGRTLSSARQAVLDGRALISWLEDTGHTEIAVLGMSLGSWVAGLIAAHDSRVSKASLFLHGGSLADMVWTGRATEALKSSLEGHLSLEELRGAWGQLNLGQHAHRLSREGLELQLILGKRDRVVLYELSRKFIAEMEAAGCRPSVKALDCGHYSLALPPFNLSVVLSLRNFL